MKKPSSYFNHLKTFILILGILGILITSCTKLQYRESDEELRTRFKEIELTPQISYYRVDSLKAKLRMLKLSKPDNKINIVFFHGSPSSLSSWNQYFNDTLLLNKANLWAIDRPGLGYSKFGKAIPSIKLQADIMNAILEDFKLKNIITVGTSYGGPLAARLAVLNENVKGVLLISSAMDPEQERQFWGSRLTQWWATRWLVPRGYRVAGDEKTIHAEELKLLEKDWEKVNVPVIHIHGDSDDIVPFGNIKYTQEQFKNIKIVKVTGVGHEISYRKSELVKPLILELIKFVEIQLDEK